MKTLYAPLPPAGWDYWLGKDTLMNIIFVLFVFSALFLVYKHQEFKQIRRVRTYFIVFFIGSTLAYNLTMSNIRADKRKYQIYIDNSAKLETFSGVIEFVGNKKKGLARAFP